MNSSLFCLLRKTWVADLPEERVRQALIRKMTKELGYPTGNLALEKQLSQLPHLKNPSLSLKRRADLIVFAKNLHPEHLFYPLLLIECKATALTEKVLRQIVGYHQFVDAYFIAAVNQNHFYLGYYHPQYKNFSFQEGLPPYSLLMELARQRNLKHDKRKSF